MLMADAFAITMIHIAALIIIPGCWVLYGGLFPEALDRGQERLRRMPFKTFLLGLGITIVLGVPALLMGNAGLGLPAGLLGIVLLLWGLFGIAPLARVIGSRLSPKSDAPWKSHALGGVVLLFPWMLFVVGYFFFAPITLIIGVGAGTLACFKRRKAVNAAPAPAPVPQEEKMEAIA